VLSSGAVVESSVIDTQDKQSTSHCRPIDTAPANADMKQILPSVSEPEVSQQQTDNSGSRQDSDAKMNIHPATAAVVKVQAPALHKTSPTAILTHTKSTSFPSLQCSQLGRSAFCLCICTLYCVL